MNEPTHQQAITGQLARYLRENPLACDTVAGIAQWWLGADRVDLVELVMALGGMERSGLVVRLLAADGQVRYRRTSLTADVDALLDELKMQDA